MNKQYVAALALAKLARQRANQPLPTIPIEVNSPVLVEGILTGHKLEVTMPSGDRWLYHFACNGGLAPRKLLVSILASEPGRAAVFELTCDAFFPCVGFASRYGIERTERGAA